MNIIRRQRRFPSKTSSTNSSQNCFVDHEPVPLLQVETERSSEHVTQREHVTLPNKEVVSAVVLATAKSPVADRRLWIDFAVILSSVS